MIHHHTRSRLRLIAIGLLGGLAVLLAFGRIANAQMMENGGDQQGQMMENGGDQQGQMMENRGDHGGRVMEDRGDHEGNDHRPSADDQNIGIGIGIGVGILNELIREHRNEERKRKIDESIRRRAKRRHRKRRHESGKEAKSKHKKNVSKIVPIPKSAPTASRKAVYEAPKFPEVAKLRSCDDCKNLWKQILKYEDIIREDTKKLFDREDGVRAETARISELRESLRHAKTKIDKVYYKSMIKNTVEHRDAIKKLNKELAQIVEWEWQILHERVDWYRDCVKRHCPIPPVIVEAPPPPKATPVSKHVETPSPPPAVSTPPVEPSPIMSLPPHDGRKICGPDITANVLQVLANMRKRYLANPKKQAAACRSLLDPKTADHAWDIYELSPVFAPVKGDHYDPANDTWHPVGKKPTGPHPWFTAVSTLCAIPRPVCGATVEFMGTCQHAQVVNYVQWGMMLSLCGTGYVWMGKLAHWVWNVHTYGSSAPGKAQNNMIQVGQEYNELLERNLSNNNAGIAAIRRRLKKNDAATKHPEKQCALKCKLTPKQKHELSTERFSFTWLGLNASSQSQRTKFSDIDLRNAKVRKRLENAIRTGAPKVNAAVRKKLGGQ